MINANELRIGNWVFVNEYKYDFMVRPTTKELIKQTPTEVSNIWDDGVNLYVMYDGEKEYKNFEDLEPIPLTPELLEKCEGFKRGCFILNTPDRVMSFIISPNSKYHPVLKQVSEFSSEPSNIFSLNYIEYLHQLQNLYFALCGKELEITNL